MLNRLVPILSLLAVTLCAGEEKAPEAIGQVVALQGEANATGADGAARKLAIKAPIHRHDLIRTGNGRLQILFVDQTVINIGRNSDMKVAEYQFRPGTGEAAMTTQVKEGSFRVMAGEIGKIAPQKFKTETPTATIGIRGSIYAGQQQGPRLSAAFIGGKGIFVQSQYGTVNINTPGHGTSVQQGGPPTPPVPFSAAQLALLEAGINQREDGGAGGPGGGQGGNADGGQGGNGEGGNADAGQGGGGQGGAPGDGQPPAGGDMAGGDQPGEGGPGGEPPATWDGSSEFVGELGGTPMPEDPAQGLGGDPTGAFDGGLGGTDPFSDPAGDVQQAAGDATTGAGQSDLQEQVTEITGSEGTFQLSGAFFGAYLDGGRWGGLLNGTTSEGAVSLSGTAGDGTPFSVLAQIGALQNFGSYTGWSYSHTGGLPRTLPGIGSFTSSLTQVYYDNVGEFLFYESLYYSPPDDEYVELGYAGRPSLTRPSSGVGYYGSYGGGRWAAGTTDSTQSPGFLESEAGKFMAGVNFYNNKFIGILMNDSNDDNYLGHTILYGSLGGTDGTAIFGKIVSDGTMESSDYLISANGSFNGQLYGVDNQGIGLTFGSPVYQKAAGTQMGDTKGAAAVFENGPAAGRSAAQSGTVRFDGAVAGVDRYSTFGNALAGNNLVLNLDFDTGTLTGSFGATGNSVSVTVPVVGGGSGSAVVSTEMFIGELSGSMTHYATPGTLSPYGSVLMTAANDPANRVASYAAWGYWFSAAQFANEHELFGTWVAGPKTPPSGMSGLGTGTYVYSGRAHVNEYIDTLGGGEHVGSSLLTMDLNAHSWVGQLNFPSANLQVQVGGGGGSIAGSDFSGGVSSVMKNSAPVTISQSRAQGSFFGPNAESAAGAFSVVGQLPRQLPSPGFNTATWVGSFGGDR